MKTVIYHNPMCSKSREALHLLEQRNEDITIIQYLKQPPTHQDLQKIITQLGINAEQLVRKNEALYKSTYQNKSYSDAEWIDIMVKHPVLIERPIVIKNNKAVIGRPPLLIIDLL